MNNSGNERDWICCQIGAREHYVIPHILYEQKQLRRLYTDIWLNPDHFISGMVNRCIPRLAGRYDSSLAESGVVSFTISALLFELVQHLLMNNGWRRIYKRNRWFQDKVISSSEFITDCNGSTSKPVVFCYSYAALSIFRQAKKHGCMTVLGQIDAGPVEENIVAEAVMSCTHLQPRWSRAPKQYWDAWEQECQLADRIIVNSHWARKALLKAGVDDKKIAVVPLMYASKNTVDHAKSYPDKFTLERPLKILFLGSLIIRKGISVLLEAVKSMQGLPVEFWFVGDKGVKLPGELTQSKQVHWIGPVDRSETSRYFQMADVFILPTLSDGFGLTQLEAMSYGLPVIASRNCGEVVQDGTNGILLHEVSGENITQAFMHCLDNPEILQHWSKNVLMTVKAFSPASVFPLLRDSIRTG
jgi:glycosyltransferase involved in cell wall biosynthesis